MRRLMHAVLGALALMVAGHAYADGPGDAGPDVAAPPVRAAPIPPSTAAAPEGQTGVIPLNGGELTLSVPNNYQFYPAEEAYSFMQRNRASAPGGTVLGLLAKRGTNVRAPGTWATVVSYDAIGYVPAETATGLEAPSLESEVRAARGAQGRPFEGFATPPSFNVEGADLAWAERSAAPGSGGSDLRYEQKALGRHGVAGLTSIGSADQLAEIAAAAEGLRGMLSFPEGRRYADFAASDQVSAYTVPGLVTGVPAVQQVAETDTKSSGQTGFGGLAGWFPWIALGVAALAGAGYLVMRRRKDDDDDATDAA